MFDEDFVMQQLETLGLNFKRPCGVEFIFFFRKSDAAEMAAQRLRSDGFRVDAAKLSGDPHWYVVARGVLSPLAAGLDKIRHRMENLAAEFGGEYDRWTIPTRNAMTLPLLASLRIATAGTLPMPAPRTEFTAAL